MSDLSNSNNYLLSDYLHTPIKDAPSLSYGVSSSPLGDLPSSIDQPSSIFRTPIATSTPKLDFSQLLPSNVQSLEFSSLESSPPVVHIKNLEPSSHPKRRKISKLLNPIDISSETELWKNSPLKKKLLPSNLFKKALENQKTINTTFTPSRPHKRKAFEVDVDTRGHVSIQTPPSSPPNDVIVNQQESVRIVEELIGDDSEDDDSDVSTNDFLRTPPRFSNLGNCDATTAFARSYTRTREVSKGASFMFPSPLRTEPEQPAPYMPATPRTPSTQYTRSFIEDEIKTPPGAIFGYENMFGTGMTPFLNSVQRI